MPISSQLRSHRLFSENWERLAYLVDAATLYHTGDIHGLLANQHSLQMNTVSCACTAKHQSIGAPYSMKPQSKLAVSDAMWTIFRSKSGCIY